MRILIVEDDAALREQVRLRLEEAGYVVETAADGRDGAWLAREYPFDAAVVDLGLPVQDGIALIREIRAAGSTLPVLILTARDGWEQKVLGLEAGGDDYLTKPFHVAELLARLNALIRRAAGHASPKIAHGRLQLDTVTHRLQVDDQPIELTAFEYRLIEYLMLHAGRVISKNELTEHLYAQDFERDSNTIEVFVGRLRRKLGAVGVDAIRTLRGQGYRFGTVPVGERT